MKNEDLKILRKPQGAFMFFNLHGLERNLGDEQPVFGTLA
jgi:hypothetical protein